MPSKIGTRDAYVRKNMPHLRRPSPESVRAYRDDELQDDYDSPRYEGREGVANISEDLLARVTQYHAQIGSTVDLETLQHLQAGMTNDALALLRQGNFDDALDIFTHALAVSEKAQEVHDRPLSERTLTAHAWRKVVNEKKQCQGQGLIIQNIGYCLHCIGELEAARAYYKQALEILAKSRRANAFIDWWRYGEETEAKIQAIKARLNDIDEGHLPYDQPGAPGWGKTSYVDARRRPMENRRAAPPSLSESYAEERLERMIERHEERRPGWLATGVAGAGDAYEEEDDDRYTRNYAHGQQQQPQRQQQQWQQQLLQRQQGDGEQEQAEQEEEADDGYGEDNAEREAARKEWLQYYMTTGEWDEASQLVVTKEEAEDLEYLVGREERQRNGEMGTAL